MWGYASWEGDEACREDFPPSAYPLQSVCNLHSEGGDAHPVIPILVGQVPRDRISVFNFSPIGSRISSLEGDTI